jgi:bifunctional DNA-binding transcriptional regulator/antitoxin component of YhaV-PrlF toxin-antitoxin module
LAAVSERFTATLGERHVVVPLDARALWGQARPPVAGTVNGFPFRSRLMVYGGQTVLGLTNAFRAEAGIAEGDEVEVVIDRDDGPREVEVPPALQAALDGDATVRAAFGALSFTHRREYATWIAGAKREATRERRAAKAVEMLRGGVKTPG